MRDIITLQFRKKPSDVLTLWQAYRSRKSRFTSKDTIPEIHAVRERLRIDPAHLNSFNSICAIDATPGLHILYPYTMVYPYLMRILCRKEMPFSQFKILNTRNRIKMLRTIKPDEIFKIHCCNTGVRIAAKGIEFDYKAEIISGKEKVWKIVATYFYPVKSGAAEEKYILPKLEPLGNAYVINSWFLEAKSRYRFGRISGDTNGIHYWSSYARMFGFRRDFAQPIRIITKCVSSLSGGNADSPADLEFFLKGPVYYDSMLTMRNLKTENINRFDLYCEGNTRPCISGKLAPV